MAANEPKILNKAVIKTEIKPKEVNMMSQNTIESKKEVIKMTDQILASPVDIHSVIDMATMNVDDPFKSKKVVAPKQMTYE